MEGTVLPAEQHSRPRSGSARKGAQAELPELPSGPEFVTFRNHAIDTWKEQHGYSPAWGGPEFKALKTALQRIGLDAAIPAWNTFVMATGEQWNWLRDHNPKVFLARLDMWRLARRPAPEPTREMDASSQRRLELLQEELAKGKGMDQARADSAARWRQEGYGG
jgi:hypothetical protein